MSSSSRPVDYSGEGVKSFACTLTTLAPLILHLQQATGHYEARRRYGQNYSKFTPDNYITTKTEPDRQRGDRCDRYVMDSDMIDAATGWPALAYSLSLQVYSLLKAKRNQLSRPLILAQLYSQLRHKQAI